ncbi:hypothetical protein BLA29_009833 [Euroglyphus maynei]|uniref:Transmembrane protein n=1 Tax=Euroglyphus maynei TaxID=6958 RepID=A0A1Y3BQB0_EURMA|nr:hypothetical protein BLA29_009833 [Euroglyphus maynei]
MDRQYIWQLQSNEQTFRMWTTIFAVLFIGIAFYYWSQTNQMEQNIRRQIEIEKRFEHLTAMIRTNQNYRKEEKHSQELIKELKRKIQSSRNQRDKSQRMVKHNNNNDKVWNEDDYDGDDNDQINNDNEIDIQQIQADIIDQIEKEINRMRSP